MKPHETIKHRRELQSLTTNEAAQMAGLSSDGYRDVEAYPDEIMNVVRLRNTKMLFRSLSIDFLSFFEIPCAFCEQGAAYSPD